MTASVNAPRSIVDDALHDRLVGARSALRNVVRIGAISSTQGPVARSSST